MSKVRFIALAFATMLVVAACGDETAAETTTSEAAAVTTTEAPVATTTEAPVATTTEAPAATTTTQAPAATTTDAPAAGEGMIPDPTTGVTLAPYAGENVTNGDVFVYWYRSVNDGNYLALYSGPGIAGADGQALCPGNSIKTTTWIHISNTPVEDASCEDFPTETASVQVCTGGVWIYETAIPGDLEGTLFASLEWNATDGTIKGLTSELATDPAMPEFEYGLGSYTLWDGFTSDGSFAITCEAPTA